MTGMSRRKEAQPEWTPPEPFVGTEEVAAFLGKPVTWIYNNADKAGLPRYKVGLIYRYRLSEVAAWVESHKA